MLADKLGAIRNRVARGGLNPLHLGSMANTNVENDAQMIAQSLSGGPSHAEPFWDISALKLLSGIICMEMEEAAGHRRQPSFRNLIHLLYAEDPYWELRLALQSQKNSELLRRDRGRRRDLENEALGALAVFQAAYRNVDKATRYLRMSKRKATDEGSDGGHGAEDVPLRATEIECNVLLGRMMAARSLAREWRPSGSELSDLLEMRRALALTHVTEGLPKIDQMLVDTLRSQLSAPGQETAQQFDLRRDAVVHDGKRRAAYLANGAARRPARVARGHSSRQLGTNLSRASRQANYNRSVRKNSGPL